MSNAARFETPDSADNGKTYVYNSGTDAHVLTDMATQAELDAHTGDTSDAHDASAISFSATGTIAATDVQAAVAEVATDAAAALTAHEAAGDPHPGYLTAAEGNAAYQPLDSDLTAIAALSTTAFGRALLALADAAALRTAGGLVIGTDVQAYSAVLAATTASFTTADETKLDGIESGATADQSAAEILAALLTVDGAGSGLDADLLDGNSSAAFATAGHNHTGTYDSAGTAAAAVSAHEAAGDPHPGYLTAAEGNAAYQPLDSDLTAIAALTTTSYGRSLLAAANAAALRTLADVDQAGTAASAVAAHEADTTSVHGIADTSTLYRSGGTDVAVADGGTGASDASGARTNLGLAIGTNVQAYDAELAALAGLTSAADRLPYFTGSGTASLATFTAAGRALVDDADAAAQRTTLGLGALAVESTITSALITNGTIVDADINASAAIAVSKLADHVLSGSNIGFGPGVLAALSSGTANVAIGQGALAAVNSGQYNMAIGYQALTAVTTGLANVAIGSSAQASMLGGSYNVAIGYTAQNAIVAASYNIAIGWAAQGSGVTTGASNLAIGATAQRDVTSGQYNVAIGYQAQYLCGQTPSTANTLTTGNGGVAIGFRAGGNSSTQRSYPVAIGYLAGTDGDYATAIGPNTLAGAGGSVAIGSTSGGVGASTTTANDIALGTSTHRVTVAGTLNLAGTTATTVGAAGAASALPANPTGYVVVKIAGTDRKIPFYAT